jgi:hypothetical protein
MFGIFHEKIFIMTNSGYFFSIKKTKKKPGSLENPVLLTSCVRDVRKRA